MRGDLSEISAADACRSLAGEAATGTLSLRGFEGYGTIVFDDGRIVGATSPSPRARLGDRLVGAGFLDDAALAWALSAQHEHRSERRLGAVLVDEGLVAFDAVRLFVQEQVFDALFELMSWRFGTFELRPRTVDDTSEVPIALSVDEALVEVARRTHEWEAVARVIPTTTAVPTFRHGAAAASAGLEPDEFAVLASVDGQRSVRELATDLGYGEFEAARIVYGLCLLGIIEVRLPEDEVGAALDDALGVTGDPTAPDTFQTDNEPDMPAADPPVEEGHDDGMTIGAELPEPSFGDVLSEFHRLAAQRPGHEQRPEPEPPPEPVEPASAEGPASVDELPDERSEPVDHAEPDQDRHPPADAPVEDGDVSEFLRELSRLALDEEEPPAGTQPKSQRQEPRPSRAKGQDDDHKRRRRGLFGWGG